MEFFRSTYFTCNELYFYIRVTTLCTGTKYRYNLPSPRPTNPPHWIPRRYINNLLPPPRSHHPTHRQKDRLLRNPTSPPFPSLHPLSQPRLRRLRPSHPPARPAHALHFKTRPLRPLTP